RGMAEAIPLGPMGQQSQKIHDILINSDICKYIWVSTTEELPVQESLEFTDQLKNEFNIQPQIVLNKVISQELPDSIEKMQSHFAKYLIKLKMREQWAFTQLSNHHQVVKVPLSFYGNFQEKLDQLAGVFSSHAQFV
ncbi:MAG: hypothetical protein KDD40_06480, partial [Bdellovibrionales bacterium]|nr:hypothetical protein [Bdellovibrionales bacterium]